LLAPGPRATLTAHAGRPERPQPAAHPGQGSRLAAGHGGVRGGPGGHPPVLQRGGRTDPRRVLRGGGRFAAGEVGDPVRASGRRRRAPAPRRAPTGEGHRGARARAPLVLDHWRRRAAATDRGHGDPAVRPRAEVRGRHGAVLGGLVRATIWGCRGSLASPGPDTVRYGGNTSCVEIRLSDDSLLV